MKITTSWYVGFILCSPAWTFHVFFSIWTQWFQGGWVVWGKRVQTGWNAASSYYIVIWITRGFKKKATRWICVCWVFSGMDELMEVSFSPIAASGKPLSRCGKCHRFMKYIQVSRNGVIIRKHAWTFHHQKVWHWPFLTSTFSKCTEVKNTHPKPLGAYSKCGRAIWAQNKIYIFHGIFLDYNILDDMTTCSILYTQQFAYKYSKIFKNHLLF